MKTSIAHKSPDADSTSETDRGEKNHWLFFVLLSGLGAYLVMSAVHDLRISNRAANWPTVKAIVSHLEVAEFSDIDGSSFYVDVEYKYQVDHMSYEGSRIAFGYSGTPVQNVHDEIYRKLRESQAIFVRYDPSDPSISCLSFGISRGVQLQLLSGAFFLTIVAHAISSWFVRADLGSYVLFTMLACEIVLFVWCFFTSDTAVLENLMVQ